MDRAEERRMIERAMRGDREAAGDCVRAHQRSLYAYILRMCGRPEVAEDVVQEAFVRALSNLDRFDFRFRFSTWLFTIARRLYLNQVQKMKPASDTDCVEARGGDWLPVGTEADAAEKTAVCRNAIQDGLMELSVDQREVLVLFHQQDWPIALIAEHLDMPEGTVKSHLHRGRRKLRRVIEQREADMRRLSDVDPVIAAAVSEADAAAPFGGGVV